MPMFSLFNSLRQNRTGEISLEFTLALLVILLVLSSLIEVGHSFY